MSRGIKLFLDRITQPNFNVATVVIPSTIYNCVAARRFTVDMKLLKDADHIKVFVSECQPEDFLFLDPAGNGIGAKLFEILSKMNCYIVETILFNALNNTSHPTSQSTESTLVTPSFQPRVDNDEKSDEADVNMEETDEEDEYTDDDEEDITTDGEEGFAHHETFEAHPIIPFSGRK